MSDWKERSVERRDFRSIKDKPEKPGALRSKKNTRPFELWRRYKPEWWEKNKDHWLCRKEDRESNNAWRPHWKCKYATLEGVEQALKHMESERHWCDYLEFKIIKVGLTEKEKKNGVGKEL